MTTPKRINRPVLDKHLRDSFDEVDIDKKAFILLLNGKRVEVSNGKKIWGSAGAAKNALNNHLRYAHNNRDIYYVSRDDEDYYEAEQEADDAIKEWVKHNIQVVSIGDFEAAQAKLRKL